ncbi:MAG: hypothetical protein DI597_19065 [Pseudoxanthomonas spadix]|nr:MAG: hypothetical protein DI597_19065 [Pseudoxanthomonas spadix]
MKIKWTSALSLTACTLLFAAASASQAQTQTPSQKAVFDEVDTNHDGYIDLAENNAANEKRFKKFDANGDGYFTRAEMIAANKKFGQSDQVAARTAQFYLSGMDTNRDDAASWTEFSTWMNTKMFAAFDIDHDGKLSKSEFIAPASPPVP